MTLDFYNRDGTKADFGEIGSEDFDREGFAKLFSPESRRVAITEYPGGARVSTMFLALDMNTAFLGPSVPLIFETMIFLHSPEVEKDPDLPPEWADLHLWTDRYPSEASALEGHAAACRLLEKTTGLAPITTGESHD